MPHLILSVPDNSNYPTLLYADTTALLNVGVTQVARHSGRTRVELRMASSLTDREKPDHLFLGADLDSANHKKVIWCLRVNGRKMENVEIVELVQQGPEILDLVLDIFDFEFLAPLAAAKIKLLTIPQLRLRLEKLE